MAVGAALARGTVVVGVVAAASPSLWAGASVVVGGSVLVGRSGGVVVVVVVVGVRVWCVCVWGRGGGPAIKDKLFLGIMKRRAGIFPQ